MTHFTWKEIFNLDARDIAVLAGCATLSGAVCATGVEYFAPGIDKNTAIFIFGSIGGFIGLIILKAAHRDK